MAQTTEAACLLQTGAMFSRRIGFKTADGVDLFAGVKPGGVSLYFGDAPIYHFDLDGRWQRAFVARVHYLKGLDTTVRSIDRDREDSGMVLRRNTLAFGQAVDLDASIRSTALDLIDDLDSGRLAILPTPEPARAFEPQEFRSFLERVSDWDATAWFAHRERYLGTYGPIPFLPPDASTSLILQATLGHASGHAFGRARPAEFYARSPTEFDEHARAVARLTGRRLGQHRGIFVAGADFPHQPTDEILAHLATIGQVFPLGSKVPHPGDGWDDFTTDLGPIHAFLDDFDGPLPDRDAWRSFQQAHLGRVTLGVESGDPAIRRDFHKKWQDSDLRAVVADLKAAGIGVGVIVLAGAGGLAGASSHVDATVRLLDSLGLDRTDLVTLVDSRSLDDGGESQVETLGDAGLAGQIAAFKSWSAAGRPSKGPKVVVYNPDKQWQ